MDAGWEVDVRGEGSGKGCEVHCVEWGIIYRMKER